MTLKLRILDILPKSEPGEYVGQATSEYIMNVLGCSASALQRNLKELCQEGKIGYKALHPTDDRNKNVYFRRRRCYWRR